MLQFIFGRAASGKTEAVFRRIEKAVLAGREDIILLVPEQFSFESERALLRRLGRTASKQVEVLSFTRLCDRVFRETGGLAGRRIDDSGRALLMGEALAETAGSLQLFGRQAGTVEFVRTMLSAAAEWKQCGITPAMLAEASQALPAGTLRAKTADLSLIYAAYDARVNARYLDPLDDLTRLYRKLEDYPFFKGKTVYADAFKGFTGQQFLVLDRILAQANAVVISFNIDPDAGRLAAGFSAGNNRQPQGHSVFSNVESVVRRLASMARSRHIPLADPVLLEESHFSHGQLVRLEKGLAGKWGEEAGTAYGKAVRVFAAASRYEEVDRAALTIRRLVREEGYRYRDIAIIARDLSAYAGSLESAMRRYDIPLFMDKRQPVDTLPLFVLVLSAMEAARNYATEPLLRYLKTGLTPLEDTEISLLEDYLFIWNITGEAWCQDFTQHPDGYVDPGKKAQDEEDVQRVQKRLDTLNALRRKVIEPIRRLHEAVFAQTAEEIGEAVWRLLTDLDAAASLRAYADELERAGEPEWADLQRQSWDILMELLDQAMYTLGDRPVGYRRFLELFRLMVSLRDAGGIPQKLDQAAAGGADRMRPGRPRAVFVLGLNQGVFPAAPGSGGVFHPAERTQLIDIGLPVTDNWLADSIEENYLLYTALTAPSEALYLSYSQADDRGQTLEPSPVIRQVQRILPDVAAVSAAGPLTLSGLQAAGPALEQLAAHWGEDTPLSRALRACLMADQQAAGRMAAIQRAAARTPAALSEKTARALFRDDIQASATQVDVYHRCRFSYFCRYGLRAKKLRQADMDVLQRGTIVHYVLEKMIQRYGAELRYTDAAGRAVDIHGFVKEYAENAMGGLDKLPPRLRYMLRRVESLLADILSRMAEEFAAGDFEPAACELVIGEKGEVPPMEVPLSEGSLSVSGAVDRVDVWNQGVRQYVRVVDYKTGSRNFNLPDVLQGLNLQMLLYLFILEEQGKPLDIETGPHPAPVAAEELLPAGILYMPSRRSMGTPEDSEKAIRRKNRMNGLLLDEPEVLKAMEKDGEGLYIPVDYNKKDGLPKKTAPLAGPADFEVLRLHIRRLLREMGDTLHKGDIAADPLDGRESPACKYCDFRSVCGREPSAPGRKVEKMSGAAALGRMREEETDGISGDGQTEAGH